MQTEKPKHYLIKKVLELPDEQRQEVVAALLADATAEPETKTDKYVMTLMADHIDSARERLEKFGKMQGLSSGYPSIDKLTKGFVGGEVIIVAGKTSYGKTTLAMNMANNIALANHRVLFVTLEMSHAELTSRYMFINGGETDDFLRVATNTVYQQNDDLGWEDIDGLIENAKLQMGVDIVIIDHLHYFSRELQNAAEDIGRITKTFSRNAKRHDIPVILISHVRKTFKDQPATMDDLRGSSYIGQDADIVLMVGRNEFGDMTVKIEKNRNRGYDHDDNDVELRFDRTKVSEMAPEPEDPVQSAFDPFGPDA